MYQDGVIVYSRILGGGGLFHVVSGKISGQLIYCGLDLNMIPVTGRNNQCSLLGLLLPSTNACMTMAMTTNDSG